MTNCFKCEKLNKVPYGEDFEYYCTQYFFTKDGTGKEFYCSSFTPALIKESQPMKKVMVIVSHKADIADYIEPIAEESKITYISMDKLQVVTSETKYQFCVLPASVDFTSLEQLLAGQVYDIVDCTRFANNLLELQEHLARIISACYAIKERE